MVSASMVTVNVFLIVLAFSPSPSFILRVVFPVIKSPGSMRWVKYHKSSGSVTRSLTVPFLKSEWRRFILSLQNRIFYISFLFYALHEQKRSGSGRCSSSGCYHSRGISWFCDIGLSCRARRPSWRTYYQYHLPCRYRRSCCCQESARSKPGQN